MISAWWLYLIVPVSASLGVFVFVLMVLGHEARSYERGYADGHQAGWELHCEISSDDSIEEVTS